MSDTPLLAVDGLSVHFASRGRSPVRAVQDVSLRLDSGRTLGLVGESGSGKTTTGRVVVGLQEPTTGTVSVDGQVLDRRRTKAQRRAVQMVFQDPTSSLNPRQRVIDAIAEPLRVQDGATKAQAREAAAEMMASVGLVAELARRYPHQLSGGQRQRVVIARALVLRPRLLVCDEPVSALDVSVQAQVVNLLSRLQRELGVGLVFIAHDLAVVRHLAHDVAVMHLGHLVESGPVDSVYEAPRHPYTVALMSAVLTTGSAGRAGGRIVLEGEIPNPAHPPSGCTFHTRCWLHEALDRPERCRVEEPGLGAGGAPVTGAHRSACHFADEVPVALARRGGAA